MIREITARELPIIHRIAVAFAEENKASYDLHIFNRFWDATISSGVGAIIAACGENEAIGMIGGITCPSPYSDVKMAQEMFWYVLPGYRGHGIRLLKAFEDWAIKHSCKKIILSALHNDDSKRINRVYARYGYKPIEMMYMKEI